MTGFELPQHL